MFKKVIVKDRTSRELVNEYLIELKQNLSREEIFNHAWQKIVNDGLVDESNRDNYFMKIEDENLII